MKKSRSYDVFTTQKSAWAAGAEAPACRRSMGLLEGRPDHDRVSADHHGDPDTVHFDVQLFAGTDPQAVLAGRAYDLAGVLLNGPAIPGGAGAPPCRPKRE